MNIQAKTCSAQSNFFSFYALRIQFKETVLALPMREKRIMELRYLAGKTQMDVAREIGISQAQVSRLEKDALEQIRHCSH